MSHTQKHIYTALRDHWTFILVAVAVVILDQITKMLIVNSIDLYHSIPAEGAFRLTHIVNTGSAFGLFQNQTTYLIMASVVGIVAIVFYYTTMSKQPSFRWAMGILLGGAIGNMIDRVLRGKVIDFVDIELWSGFHFPAFNVADASINVGFFMILFVILKSQLRKG
jgi:signal peptidase II